MELSAPITIYWDLPCGGGDADLLRHTCADILSCRPLMLQLSDLSPTLPLETLDLLTLLKGAPLALSLTMLPAALTPAALGAIRAAGPKELLVAPESLAELSAWLRQTTPLPSGPKLGVSFGVNGANWRELPALIALLRAHGIGRLVLPMQRIYRGESPFFLDTAAQEWLAEALGQGSAASGLELTIHDPFLWRPFYPGLPFPQGGCQAANTMLAIAPDRTVYPCPTLPWSLGSLSDATLKEIVASPLKKEFRRTLLELTDACLCCSEAAVCRGGCRGRGYLTHRCLHGADPACPMGGADGETAAPAAGRSAAAEDRSQGSRMR